MKAATFVPIIANQAVSLALGIVGLKITSLIVAPGVYGRYAIFLTLTQIGVLLTHSGLINLVSRHWRRGAAQADTLALFAWRRSWKALLWLTPALLVLGVGLRLAFGDITWIVVLPMLIVANLAVAITEIGAAALNASERHWPLLAFRTFATASRLALPLLFALYLGGGYLALVVGFAVNGLLMIPVSGLALHPKKSSATSAISDFAHWETALREYGRPFAVMGIGGWLMQNADRWIVERFFGAEQAGQFAMAAGVGGVVPAFLIAVLLQAFFPTAFRKADAARSVEDWKRLARRCDYMTVGFLSATLVALGVLSLLGPVLVGHLVAPSYAPAIQILFVSGLAMASVQTNQFQYLLLQGRRDSRAMVRVMAVVAGVKTAGSVTSALISWDVFSYWLGFSVLVCAILGRGLIRRSLFATGPLQTGDAAQ
jgi:O-antigen/teichoic acid export membrane protein